MSEVKRYAPKLRRGIYYGMDQYKTGDYVLHSDYAAVEAERDELARALCGASSYTADGTRTACRVCMEFHDIGHMPECPVKLAERIIKEAGDGR